MTREDRLRELVDAVLEAVKQVVWDKEVTEDELHAAADFLNRIGEARVFPSLLDIAFAMTVVDRIRFGTPGTRPNLLGPMYRDGAPVRPGGWLFDGDPSPGARLVTIHGRLTDAGTGEPIADAELDFWHADESGEYDVVGDHLRGIVKTGADGSYVVRTVLPEEYSEHDDDPIGELLELMGRSNYRAAHIHLKVRVEGEDRLTTQFFHRFSPHLDADYVVGAVSEDLIIDFQPVPSDDGFEQFEGEFSIALAPIKHPASV